MNEYRFLKRRLSSANIINGKVNRKITYVKTGMLIGIKRCLKQMKYDEHVTYTTELSKITEDLKRVFYLIRSIPSKEGAVQREFELLHNYIHKVVGNHEGYLAPLTKYLNEWDRLEYHPFFEIIFEKLRSGENWTMVLHPQNSASEVKKTFIGLVGNLKDVIHWRELELRHNIDENLLIIGRPSWYRFMVHDYTSGNIEFLTFDYPADFDVPKLNIPSEYIISGGFNTYEVVEQEGYQRDLSEEDDDIVDEEKEKLGDSVNISRLKSDVIQEGENSGKDALIHGNVVILDDEYWTVINSDPDARIPTIQIRGTTPGFEYLKKKDLEVDMFMVLIDGDSHDLLDPHTKQVLGSKFQVFNQERLKWKIKLHGEVYSKNKDTVISELQNRGLHIASYANLYNWMSFDTYRPQSDEDFRILLSYLGYTDELESVMNNMSELLNARKVAGRSVNKELRDRVDELDIHELLSKGHAKIRYDEQSEHELHAIRIVDIDDENVSVGYHQTLNLNTNKKATGQNYELF